jgi:hypothetical protein
MEKKSLIATLKTTKKANVISTAARNEAAKNEGTSTRKRSFRRTKMLTAKAPKM